MLDERRIEEAKRNVRCYLDEGLLRKAAVDDNVVGILLKNSKESMDVARIVFDGGHSYLWAIVCSYYSMFYMANAVLNKLGYRVGERIAHKVTADALIVFARSHVADAMIEGYEDTRDEAMGVAAFGADEVIESFDLERKKRGRIQYSTSAEAKREKARTSLERAKMFVFVMDEFLV